MTKVKIVQVAVTSDDSSMDMYFLDDKGRVWYDGGHMEQDTNNNVTHSKWVTEWKQVDLPEQPES